MNQKQKNVLNKLLALYAELYPARDAFKSNLFAETPEDVAEIIREISESSDLSIKKKNVLIQDEILQISSVDQVRDYILKLDLLSGKYDSISENKAASALTLADYKHLYSILYTTPVNAKIKKDILISHIIKYFDGIDRAQSLKP